MASDENDRAKTTLAELGEFAVIDQLVWGREQPPVVMVGPGDDAAVVLAADGRTVVSTDMLIEGGTSDWTGRPRATSAARPSPRTRPTSRPWVQRPLPSSSRSALPARRPVTTCSHCTTACGGGPQVRGGIAGGDLVAAPQWVISVTALGDLQFARPSSWTVPALVTRWR